MRALIAFFAKRHLPTNLLFFGVLLSAWGLWDQLGKEEYPDFAVDWVRCNLAYPGATAQDVEEFVIKPIEKRLKELSGLDEVRATASAGGASFRIHLGTQVDDVDALIQDIKNSVDRADLPDVVEDPVFRRFSSKEKAIIDIGLYMEGQRLLSVQERQDLQALALAFESQILALPQISGLDVRGYLRPEIQIQLDPKKMERKRLSLQRIRQQIQAQHVRTPSGSLKDRQESKVSFVSNMDTPQALSRMVVEGGLEGQKIRLGHVADVDHGFEPSTSILKVQGHEGLLYSIQKSASVDILTAQKAVMTFIDGFQAANPGTPLKLIPIDDESYDIRNRLSIIGTNGLVGFVLILIVLLIFLDWVSGLWVAMGIPFSLAFTVLGALILGYTVNNMTLAGVIIVLGIVVDDAIIIAENVSRQRREGKTSAQAAIDGTQAVLLPVLASILTTCAAFLPLLFFRGRFGVFVAILPAMVSLMLAASLTESALILPGHLSASGSFLGRTKSRHWFDGIERFYARVLEKVLRVRWFGVLIFVGLMAYAGHLFMRDMKFVLFPREETRELTIRVKADPKTTREEMAKITEDAEDVFVQDTRQVVKSVLTFVAQSRRGGASRDHEATLRVEVTPPGEREVSIAILMKDWEAALNKVEGLEEVRILKSRWGSDSGSPIEFEIRENDDAKRTMLVQQAVDQLRTWLELSNVEVERPLLRREHRVYLKPDRVFDFGIQPADLAQDLRTYVQGQILYTLNTGEEEMDVRLTAKDWVKKNIWSVLNLKSSNQDGYLIPFASVSRLETLDAPISIQRINFKRTTKVFADLREKKQVTPLDIAGKLERDVFPTLLASVPSAIFAFRGEIEDSRESQADFDIAIAFSLSLMFVLLALLYNSLTLPFLIGAIIPFGAVGVVLAFHFHGMLHYGFFAVIGTLGMIGVVVNDSIVMVSKLEDDVQEMADQKGLRQRIAAICSTRLRAIVVTTLTTVAGLFPTAYGWAGYDSMLAEMMLAMGWGLLFSTLLTLFLVPMLYSFYAQVRQWLGARS